MPKSSKRRHPSRSLVYLAPDLALWISEHECSDFWPAQSRHRTWLPNKRSATGSSERVAHRRGRGHRRRSCASFWTELAVVFFPSTPRTATSLTEATRLRCPRLDLVLSPVLFLFPALVLFLDPSLAPVLVPAPVPVLSPVLSPVPALVPVPVPAPVPGSPSWPPGSCSCSETCWCSRPVLSRRRPSSSSSSSLSGSSPSARDFLSATNTWWTVNLLCYRVSLRRCEQGEDRCLFSPSRIRSSDDPVRSATSPKSPLQEDEHRFPIPLRSRILSLPRNCSFPRPRPPLLLSSLCQLRLVLPELAWVAAELHGYLCLKNDSERLATQARRCRNLWR